MKQYTTPEQTTKLIELGFEKPKSISSIKVTGNIITTAEDLIGEPTSVMGGKKTANYSIGELIEMLPDVINILYHAILKIEIRGLKWHVKYDGDRGLEYLTYNSQLIDALYDMCVKLKEEGVI